MVILSDSTRVWLNASSSISFPVTFSKDERVVELTGEAYFEVKTIIEASPDGGQVRKRPFKVKIGDLEIEVLGTHFNVNAYGDDHAINTALLEGSVRAMQHAESKTIVPGQEVRVDMTGKMEVVNNINVDKVIAWKNGLFHFDRTRVTDIMKQLSRWYDVDVEYEKNFDDKTFSGKISRNVNASQVLAMLAYADVHYRIEGKKVIVY